MKEKEINEKDLENVSGGSEVKFLVDNKEINIKSDDNGSYKVFVDGEIAITKEHSKAGKSTSDRLQVYKDKF